MCFLEVTLKHFQYDLKRKIMIEDVNKNPIPVATYQTEKRI